MIMVNAKDLIDPKLVDEIVEEIAAEMKADKGAGKPTQTTLPQADMMKVKQQLENLQNAFEIDEVEIERQVTEKFEKVSDEMDSRITRLEGQINDLRTALIRLSGEIRRMKEEKAGTA